MKHFLLQRIFYVVFIDKVKTTRQQRTPGGTGNNQFESRQDLPLPGIEPRSKKSRRRISGSNYFWATFVFLSSARVKLTQLDFLVKA